VRLLLASGEVSGDVAGAGLAEAILRLEPTASLHGLGGARMARAGVHLDFDTNGMGTVGISESLRALPALARAVARLRRGLAERPADAAVLIGNDVFSVLLGRWLRRRGIWTASYFPPQVWVWRSLARPIARSFDALFTCFPDEHEIYARAGGRAVYVGHYLGDRLRPPTDGERAALREQLGVAGRPVVALLPGSRHHEVARLAPVLLQAAARLAQRPDRPAFLLPVADPALRPALLLALSRHAPAAGVRLVDPGLDALRAADVALLASGTATLEAALLGVPMVIAYRVSRTTLAVLQTSQALGLLRTDLAGLPNLVLGRPAVPELIQDRLSAEAVALAGAALLDEPARREHLCRDLAEVAARVAGLGSLDRVAEAVLEAARQRRAPAAAPELAELCSLEERT
jgi:lipid-A-disaccharide synthase